MFGRRNFGFAIAILLGVICSGPFRVAAAEGTIDFTYQSLTNLGPCASSRVLLCNNDFNNTCRIEGQGYYDTNETTTAVGGTFWWHDDAAKPTSTANTYLNLLPGITHVLYQKIDDSGSRKALWTLKQCRTGAGGYKATSGTTNGRRNYLPWSETCQPIDTNNFTAPIPAEWKSGTANMGGIKQVAQISMRCIEGACIYSPLYEDGIGEIYFDVVNGWALATPDSIEVQIATSVTEREDATGEGEDDNRYADEMVDNLDLESDYQWKTVPCDMFVVRDKESITLPSANSNVEELVLDTDAYYDSMYYRVRVKLNHNGAVRFRIRRKTSTVSSTNLDYGGLIFIDNIIVSYPGVSAQLTPMGVLSQSDDSSENGGRANLGYVGAFTEPILSRGLEGAKPRMSFSAVTNGQPPWAVAQAEVSKASCVYRWKYLNQAYGPWKTNTVDDVTVYDGTNVIWDTAIEVPDKVGDIEYSYSAWVSGTRYKFFDFALDEGKKLDFPDDSASATFVEAGTNYWSRIREGVSPWQEMHLESLVITNAEKELIVTNNWTMELIDDHNWRGFVHTPTNYAGCVANIRFVGKNMWESNGVAPSVKSKTWYFPVGEVTEIPMGGVAPESIEGDEQDIVLDATSGYLMFEFNDESGAFTMNRAEYQDFNKWTPSAGQEDNKYIGNYVNTSYVGRAKQEYTLDLGSWPMSRSTSAYWWENFDSMAGNADYPFDVPFGLNQQTPNGWTASKGMYVNGMFSAVTNKTTYGMALQLQGRGNGTLSLIDPADQPQGIGTVSFSARLAQYLEFGDFYYYVDGTGKNNYAISAKVAMTNHRKAYSDVSTGSPSLSMVTYYRPGKGCYELRVTRTSTASATDIWAKNGKMDISIYKWHMVADPETGEQGWQAKKLSSVTYSDDVSNYLIPNTLGTNVIDNANWSSMYFAAYTSGGSTYLEGGIASNACSTAYAYDDMKTTANKMKVVTFTDSVDPLVKGSYGVCTKECPGTFGNIQIHNVSGVGPYKNASTGVFSTSKFAACPEGSTTEEGSWSWLDKTIADGDWGSGSANRIVKWIDNPKYDYVTAGNYVYGLCAAPVSQKLYLKTAPIGDSSNWKDTGLDLTLTSYVATNVVFSPRTTTPANIQIAVGGDDRSARTDVAIDDIQLSQWAGDSSVSSDLGSMTKWAFTDGWIAGTTNDVYQGAGSSSDDSVAAVTKCGYYVKHLNDTEFIYVFTNTTAGALGNYAEFVPKQDMIVKEVFVLGAGGGGGPGGGGGGGGSAIWVTNDVEYTAGESGIQIYVGNGGSGGGKITSNMNPANSGSGGTSYVKLKNPLKPSNVQTYSGYGGGAGGAYESGRTNGVNSASSAAGGGGSACKSTVSAKGSAAYASGFGGKAFDGAPGGGGGGGLRGIRPSDGSNSASTSPSSVIFAGTNGMDGTAGAYGGKGGDGFPVSALGESEIRYAIAELVAGNKNADVWLGGGGGGGSGESTNANMGKGAGVSGAGGNGGGGQGGQYTAIQGGTSTYDSPGFAQGHNAALYTGGGGGGGSFYNPVSSGGSKTKNWIIGGGTGAGGLVVMHVKIKDRFVMLQPMRGSETDPMSVRTLFLNGISLLSFSWKDAHKDAILKVQLATNGVDSTNVRGISESLENGWTDFGEPIKFADMDDATRAQGSTNILMGLRAPKSGIVRLLVDPAVVAEARKGSTNDLDSMYGTVIITGMKVFDEPELDDRSWWGWNIMPTYKLEWSSLYDPVTLGPGRSCGLNFSGILPNGWTVDTMNSKEKANDPENPLFAVDTQDDFTRAEFDKHDPFVQTPRFTNRIGAVMFKARVLETNSTQSGWVTISGSKDSGAEDFDENGNPNWVVLTNIEVTASTTVFEPFLWRIPTSQSEYEALRLTVKGAKSGRNSPDAVETPIQRVLIDEVVVTQPMAPKLEFENAYPFRRNLFSTTNSVSDIASSDEQPLLGETFGMQAQIIPAGMEDELDKDSIRVYMAWYAGESPWGYNNWKNEKYATKKVELKRASDWSHGNLVYRSDPNDPNSFIPPQMAGANGYQIVQYHIWAEYSNMNGMPQDDAVLTSADWIRPSWYFGIRDPNELNNDFCAYTVLDSISPKRAWFNEINTFDGDLMDTTRQFIEVAVPQGFDMTGWAVQYIKNDDKYNAGLAAMFGSGDVSAYKTANAVNSYSFIALQSPKTKAANSYSGVNDGTWSESAFENGVVDVSNPYALRLVRPTGIIEHEVVFMSTNTSTSRVSYQFEGTNLLKNLKAKLPRPSGNDWIYSGADGWAGSLGVFKSHGENSLCWTNTFVNAHQTPGKVNMLPDGSLQSIDPTYFEPPTGTNLWIYANIAPDSMNSLKMVFGDVTNTSAVIIVPQSADGTFSTSIVYEVTKWFELDSVTTNESGKAAAAVPEASGKRGIWTLDLKGLKMSDPECRQFEVTASTKDSSNIPSAANGGIDKSDPYYPAVVKWLQNYDEGPIKFAEFWGLDNVKRGHPLNLKQMYWLDIPPVGSEGAWETSDWVFKGGMAAGARPGCVYDTVVNGYVTNIRVGVTMMITNRYKNTCRGVNLLRGLEPDSTSSDYNEKTSSHSWTSVTFKITGALQNGVVDKWYRPLRWFTLGPDSFTEENGYTRYIDVMDPFSKSSMGYSYDWHNYPDCNVWYRWRIDHDTNRPPDTVYQLNDENALFGN